MIIVFVVGYTCIACEHPLKIDKAATALMLAGLMWLLFIFGKDSILNNNAPGWEKYCTENSITDIHDSEKQTDYVLDQESLHHLGETSETLFFLLGAMTVVAIMDRHNGFEIITKRIKTRSKKKLLVLLSIVTFFMSALLDNLTTTIVMITLLNKLVKDDHLRWTYAGMIIIAANAGGAWSPIGDVTTIMLWIKGFISGPKVVATLLAPSLVAMAVPLALLCIKIKGDIETVETKPEMLGETPKSHMQRFCFWWGISSLLLVPILKSLFHLKPYMGMILVLGVFWLITDLVHHIKGDHKDNSVVRILSTVDTATILFFLGILTAVAALQTAGHLQGLSRFLTNVMDNNPYGIGLSIGVLSSVVDNVPLVAGAMGMYDMPVGDMITPENIQFVKDGVFWQLLAYAAGTGGSILIIGSAAGVAAMGLEKISFGWYFKHFSGLALLGYLAGAACFTLMAGLML